jgi:N-methylhydantoinase A
MALDNGLAIDVGGTFTDVVLFDADSGRFRLGKVLSTPQDPSIGSVAGAESILERWSVQPESIGRVVHATTVATNAVLERKGARVALLTTRGFRDTLEIGREYRYDIYDLGLQMPAPLVPRSRRMEIDERVSAQGEVIVAMDDADARAVLQGLLDDDQVQAIAVCLLNSFEVPEHEVRLRELGLEIMPGVAFSLSHEVAGEIREFERTSTTVMDAYVKPLVREYVERLGKGLADLGLSPRVAMMLSHGGVAPAEDVAREFPVRILESGPAAGAIAAAEVAKLALPKANAVAFDMGGTTAKISVVHDGEPQVTNEFEVAHVHRFQRGSGLALQLRAIELLEIGAGGGSVAHVNALGLLKVGPESAGAVPGPACYGAGGKRPCVTDADLLLGYLDPDNFLGGDLRLEPELAASALRHDICEELGLTVQQAAWGVHELVNENMAAAIRAHAAETGIDLRDFAIIAFGGAGPVHAYDVARRLGVSRVVCPFGAGVASALGCLVAPPAIDQVKVLTGELDSYDWTRARDQVEVLEGVAHRTIEGLYHVADADADAEAVSGPAVESQIALDMRCQGQGFSITVSLPPAVPIGPRSAESIGQLFETQYRAVYGHAPPRVPLEIVNLRVRTIAKDDHLPGLAHVQAGDVSPTLDDALKGQRELWFSGDDDATMARVFDRYRLPTDVEVSGPAVIEERETTVVVGSDATFRADKHRNLIINIAERPVHGPRTSE